MNDTVGTRNPAKLKISVYMSISFPGMMTSSSHKINLDILDLRGRAGVFVCLFAFVFAFFVFVLFCVVFFLVFNFCFCFVF